MGIRLIRDEYPNGASIHWQRIGIRPESSRRTAIHFYGQFVSSIRDEYQMVSDVPEKAVLTIIINVGNVSHSN